MAFVTHEQGIERTCALVESERGESATHLQLLVAARQLAAELKRLRRPSIDEVPADGQVYRRDQVVPVWCVRCPDCGNMIGHPSFGEAAGREAVADWLPFHRIRCEGRRS